MLVQARLANQLVQQQIAGLQSGDWVILRHPKFSGIEQFKKGKGNEEICQKELPIGVPIPDSPRKLSVDL